MKNVVTYFICKYEPQRFICVYSFECLFYSVVFVCSCIDFFFPFMICSHVRQSWWILMKIKAQDPLLLRMGMYEISQTRILDSPPCLSQLVLSPLLCVHSWRPSCEAQLTNIRFPPTTSTNERELAVEQEVEAFLPHKEEEPSGWWLGKIAKVRGDLIVVEFSDEDHTYTDIVDRENIRPANKKWVMVSLSSPFVLHSFVTANLEFFLSKFCIKMVFDAFLILFLVISSIICGMYVYPCYILV